MPISEFNREQVSQFYDDFLKSRMLHYRVYGNERLDLAYKFIRPYICPESSILEIGCGIGIITEKMALAASHGNVWACDLSEKNIWYAQQTLKPRNIQYATIDILEEFKILQEWILRSMDLIIMVDVLEHLPSNHHITIFQNLRQILKPNGLIVLTFPSEYYQTYIREQHPQELQPIDEIISLTHLTHVAQSANLSIKHYELVSVWMRHQYVHCVLCHYENTMILPLEVSSPSYLTRILGYLNAIIKHKILVPYRRRRYIQSVFDSIESNDV
jgi:trans-aconitate 2-methyltransferase